MGLNWNELSIYNIHKDLGDKMTEYKIFATVEATIKLILKIDAESEDSAEKLAIEKIIEELEVKENRFEVNDLTVDSIRVMIDNQHESDFDEPE